MEQRSMTWQRGQEYETVFLTGAERFAYAKSRRRPQVTAARNSGARPRHTSRYVASWRRSHWLPRARSRVCRRGLAHFVDADRAATTARARQAEASQVL